MNDKWFGVQVKEMEVLAHRYREENRRIYNEVQDLKGKIRVFCRVRPAGATGDGAPSCIEVGVDGQVWRLRFSMCMTHV